MHQEIHIGIDLDNTLISYDDLLWRLAVEREWIAEDTIPRKSVIREVLRQSANGEEIWQQLQGLAYGSFASLATWIPGAKDFLSICRDKQIRVSIVSHKTQFAMRDPTRTDLRVAAMHWLDNHSTFTNHPAGIKHSDVYFEDTRQNKLERIKQLKCTHFIDDLSEVLDDPLFPRSTRGFLLNSSAVRHRSNRFTICENWIAASHAIFSSLQY